MRAGIWVLGGGALLLGVGGAALGPGAPALVDWLADGRAVGPFGIVRMDGVSGAHLGDLRIAEITLADGAGVYAVARDARLSWSPFDLLTGTARIEELRVQTVEIARRPALAAPPTERPGPKLRLALVEVAALRLAPGALDPIPLEAAKSASFALTVRDLAIDAAPTRFAASAQNLDGGSDVIAATLRDGAFQLRWASAVDGLLGTAANAGGAVDVTADATLSNGDWRGALTAAIAGREAVRMQGAGAADRLEITGQARLDATARTAPLAARLGPSVDVRVTLASGQAQAALQTARAKAEARVAWGADGPQWPAQAQLVTDDLTRIAPELSAGPARLLGALRPRLGGGFSFDGEGAVSRVRLGAALVTAEGPVSLSAAAEGLSAIAQLRLAAQSGDPRGLWRGANLAVQARWRPDAAPEIRLTLTGDALSADLRGDGAALAGPWRVSDLARVHPGAPQGVAVGTVEIAGAQLRISGEATGLRAESGPAADLVEMVGRRARFSLQGAARAGGLDVALGRLDSDRVRLGVRGRIGPQLDVAFEAALRGPAAFGGAQIEGMVEAKGMVFGPMGVPQMTAQVRAPGAATPLGDLTGLVGEVEADAKGARVRFEAIGPRGPVTAQAEMVFTPAGLDARAVRARMDGLAFAGAGGVSAQGLRLAGEFAGRAEALDPALSGALAGLVEITPQRVSFEATLKDGRIGVFEMDLVSVRAVGPADAIAVEGALIGRAQGETVALTLTGQAGLSPGGARLSAALSGRAGGADLSSDGPFTLAAQAGRVSAVGQLRWGAGRLSADLAAEPTRAWRAQLDAENLDLAPLLALSGEPGAGRLDGTLALVRTPSGALLGAGRGRAAGLRLAARAPDPLDLDFDLKLSGPYGQLRVDARGPDGLSVQLEAQAPLSAQDAPFTVALARDGVARASWRVEGSAAPLWAAFGPLDQRVTGRLQGAGLVEIAPNGLSGAGAASLSGATFEDPATGLALTDLAAAARFDDQGLTITAFNAKGRDGGTVRGEGVVRSAEQGEIRLVLDRLLAVDREDVRVVGSGPLTASWRDGATLVSGRLDIDEAQARPPRESAARIMLPVREINRAAAAPSQAAPVAALGAKLNLDLTMRAPSRVFARGRGLQSEWALELKLGGDVAAPILTGQARLLRGDVSVAGRTFDVTSGEVRFAGPLADARLDLTAERQGVDLAAQIRVSGPLTRPQIALTSTPALPAEEILPRVLFGRAGADLSPLEAAQLAASLAELSGQPGLDFAGAARDLIRLDRLDVRQTGDSVVLAGGKYLTPEVYLELSRSSLGQSQAALEWRIRPQFFLISRFDAAGDARLSIRWREED